MHATYLPCHIRLDYLSLELLDIQCTFLFHSVHYQMPLNINMLRNAHGVADFSALTLGLLQTHKYSSAHRRTKKSKESALVPLCAMNAYGHAG